MKRWFWRLARIQPWYVLTRFPNRLTRSAFILVNSGISIAILAAAAAYTDQPLLFPSLGPSAFLFFYRPLAPSSSPRNAILAHGGAILIGWMAFALFQEGIPGGRITAVTIALSLTNVLMVATNLAHPPAASTALMVSLGLMTGGPVLLALMAAIVLLTAQAYVIHRLSGVSFPLWSPRPGPGRDGLVPRALETEAPPAPTDAFTSVADRLVERRGAVPSGGTAPKRNFPGMPTGS